MNKILALILFLSISIASFFGCSYIEHFIEEAPGIVNPEEPIIDSLPTTDNEQQKIKDKSHLENIGKPIDHINISEGKVDNNSNLASTLRSYLEQYHTISDPRLKTLSKRIDDIKNGVQPLHVAFDPDNYYFVGAYYNFPNDHDETSYYCCVNDYTWICYKNASSIQEYYNGKKCLEVFQVNLALTITDIVSGDRAVPDIQHFQLYTPTFENGFNTQTPLLFDDMFIYLNYPDLELNQFSQSTSTVYYCNSIYYQPIVEIPCVYIDGTYCIPFYMYTLYNDGKQSSKNDYTYEFGKYYDTLTNMMQYERYTVTYGNGVAIYAVVSIEDFFDVLVD